jgi:hypothetical protein
VRNGQGSFNLKGSIIYKMLIFIGLLFSVIGFGVVISGILNFFKVRRLPANPAKTTG